MNQLGLNRLDTPSVPLTGGISVTIPLARMLFHPSSPLHPRHKESPP